MKFEQATKHQENTVLAETTESLKHKKASRHLGGILTLVAALESTPAQAIEIEPTTSFETAVTTTLRENALQGASEVYAPYIRSKDGSMGQWLPVIAGETSEVEVRPAEIAKQIIEIAKESDVEEVMFCNIHTHPLASALAHNDLTIEEAEAIKRDEFSVSLPPSPADVNPYMHRMSSLVMNETIREAESDVAITSVNAVVDPLGITYFRSMPTDELAEKYPAVYEESTSLQDSYNAIEEQLGTLIKKLSDPELLRLYEEFDDLPEAVGRFEMEYVLPLYMTSADLQNLSTLQSLASEHPSITEILSDAEQLQITRDERKMAAEEALQNWITASMIPGADAKTMRTGQEYTGLLELYAASGVALRLVGYDELANEPACAGVDYEATE